jgi:hypothetical protein
VKQSPISFCSPDCWLEIRQAASTGVPGFLISIHLNCTRRWSLNSRSLLRPYFGDHRLYIYKNEPLRGREHLVTTTRCARTVCQIFTSYVACSSALLFQSKIPKESFTAVPTLGPALSNTKCGPTRGAGHSVSPWPHLLTACGHSSLPWGLSRCELRPQPPLLPRVCQIGAACVHVGS